MENKIIELACIYLFNKNTSYVCNETLRGIQIRPHRCSYKFLVLLRNFFFFFLHFYPHADSIEDGLRSWPQAVFYLEKLTVVRHPY